MAVADDDGAAQPFGHGKFALEGIVIDDDMFIEFHDMVVVELFFVDIYSGCCDASHTSYLWRRRGPMLFGVRTDGARWMLMCSSDLFC